MLQARIVTCSLVVIFGLQIGAFSSRTALAQTLNAKRPPAKAKPAPARPVSPPPAPANSGFYVPENETWSTIQPLQGYADTKIHSLGLSIHASFFGPGFGLEYLHREKSWLDWGVALHHSQANLEKEKVSGATEFLKANANSIRFFTRYVGFKWAYIGAALDYFNIKGEYGWKGSAIAQSPLKTDVTAQTATLGLFCGTEWDGPWNSYIGVDAFGFAMPLFGTVTYYENSDVDLTSKLLAGGDIESRVGEEVAAQLKFYYLNLRIGYRF